MIQYCPVCNELRETEEEVREYYFPFRGLVVSNIVKCKECGYIISVYPVN